MDEREGKVTAGWREFKKVHLKVEEHQDGRDKKHARYYYGKGKAF